MTKTLLPAALALMLAAAPVAAFDVASMTETERAAFGEAVRSYLMDNPEVILEAVRTLEDRQQQQSVNDDLAMLEANRTAIYEDANSWVGGNPEGDITLVEFLDYRCGYCRKAYEEVEELVKSDNNIRFVIKEFPILGEGSLLSSKFAIATRMLAGDDAYKRAHDALITLRGDATAESLGALADQLGLDRTAVQAKMETPEVAQIIAANHALADIMQINGTPSFV
ncbi:MAG: DsbA family protein, partial [Gemmobacter sp.]|nr:DsbA family protein [Gemmobacter sp.]